MRPRRSRGARRRRSRCRAGGRRGRAPPASRAWRASRDALTIDIGGTSADAGLIVGGEPMVEPGGDVAGVPIALPRVLVETVSAGGGSVGWVDDGGALRVGPRSAGAVPGPAAFGRGGTRGRRSPTRTSCSATSRATRLERRRRARRATRRARRSARWRRAPARRAERARGARDGRGRRRGDGARAAAGERGARHRSAALALVAFGGGGPLHACALAEQLGVRRVLVPPFAGVLSALGLALAPERREVLASVMRRADASTAAGDARARRAPARAGARRRRERQWWRARATRGRGTSSRCRSRRATPARRSRARFAAAHDARYRLRARRAVEIVSARHTVFGGQARDAAPGVGAASARAVRSAGPAVLALPDATLLVRAGWRARALPIGGWMLERDA